MTTTQERADQIRAAIPSVSPWLREADAPLLRETAMTIALLEGVTEYLGRHGAIDGRGRQRSVMTLFMKLSALSVRQCNSLALSPVARTELGVQAAVRRNDLAMAFLDHRRSKARTELGAGKSDSADNGDSE